MTDASTGDAITYTAVINDEEQFSLWRTDRDPPPGWSRVGPVGSREEIVSYIETVWTDMRPRSVREAMNADQRPPAEVTGADSGSR